MTYALITGASSGIGLELAKLFAADHDLILVSRNQERLEAIANELDCKCICIAKDLSDLSQVKELVNETRELDIEILVNNAGFGEHGEFTKLDADRQIEMINLNISALTYLCHAFAQRGRGSILNVSSVAAYAPGPMMATYYSTKAYVLNFSFALAEELKAKGIQVSVACPGPTVTNFGKVAKVDKSIPFKVSMSGERVARIIVDEFKQGKTLIVTGLRNKFLVALIKLMPRGFSSWVNYLLLKE
ncbi:MAG: SDR family oxidoreductase [Cyanobacteria bacterium]|nr:SDR family oxidoreductase [Cyanobacteriota bacterium]